MLYTGAASEKAEMSCSESHVLSLGTLRGTTPPSVLGYTNPGNGYAQGDVGKYPYDLHVKAIQGLCSISIQTP